MLIYEGAASHVQHHPARGWSWVIHVFLIARTATVLPAPLEPELCLPTAPAHLGLLTGCMDEDGIC